MRMLGLRLWCVTTKVPVALNFNFHQALYQAATVSSFPDLPVALVTRI